jgi:small neutral amino acid transporter SnatA (MarC family)
MTFTLKFFDTGSPNFRDISVPLTFPVSQSPYSITVIPIYSAGHSPVSLSTLLLNLMRVLAVTVLPAILVSPLQINTVMLQGW